MSCISYLNKKNYSIYCEIVSVLACCSPSGWLIFSFSCAVCRFAFHFNDKCTVSFSLFSLLIRQLLKEIVYLISVCMFPWHRTWRWLTVCDLMTLIHLFSHTFMVLLSVWENSKLCFYAFEGHFGKKTPFVGLFRTKVNY